MSTDGIVPGEKLILEGLIDKNHKRGARLIAGIKATTLYQSNAWFAQNVGSRAREGSKPRFTFLERLQSAHKQPAD